MTFFIPRWFRFCLLGVQAGVGGLAFVESPGVGLVASLVSLLAIGRYWSMLAFGRSLGAATGAMAVSVALWLFFLTGLLACLWFAATRVPNALPWAAAAACIGPACVSVWAVGEGLRRLRRGVAVGGAEKSNDEGGTA